LTAPNRPEAKLPLFTAGTKTTMRGLDAAS
jgi:hypothetical protein